ncbi:MAG TPA: Gfo/Idh/MocA family oxidoreductase [Fimbriimonadaceae bacterium]|mgnify:CR=1 FL=1|nr:Gfo/Idh/MocA family oxidoreductase [Fimbriimonadaceae bacterium]
MSKKLKIGLIGTGGIAVGCHMPGYASIPDQCEMVAACDVNREAATKAAEKFGIARVTTDYKELLADPEIDAVSVTTPNAFHMQPTIDALRAGKHVLCEKPLAMNADEARAMCRAAKESGKLLQVALQTRFGGPARFMRTFIDNGHLGDVYYARAWALRRRGVPHWGVFIDKEKQGGGPLIDIGVHILDFTLYLMGYPKPVAASGKTWDILGKDPTIANFWGEYDRTKFTVEDFAAGFIRFDNGAVVTLESSFMANMEGDPFQTQLFGTKAGAIVRGWGDNPVRIFKEIDRQFFELNPQNVPQVESSHTAEVQAFVRAILDGGPSPVPGEHGLILNAIFDALYKSSETGREEPIDASY